MRRLLVTALLLAACSSTPAPTSLEGCNWNPSTQVGFLSSFSCLDGKASPAGLPSPAVINVWGSWCEPCRKEIPYFVKLDEKYDVTIVGVDVDEAKISNGQKFAMNSGMTWPNLYDVEGKSISIYGPGTPVTWFLDANGRVAYKKIGAWGSYRELEAAAKKYGSIK